MSLSWKTKTTQTRKENYSNKYTFKESQAPSACLAVFTLSTPLIERSESTKKVCWVFFLHARNTLSLPHLPHDSVDRATHHHTIINCAVQTYHPRLFCGAALIRSSTQTLLLSSSIFIHRVDEAVLLLSSFFFFTSPLHVIISSRFGFHQ